MIIDIFIAVAEKGGVENVINQIGTHLTRNGIKVRLVQAVWEHYSWTVPEIDFHYLYDDRNNQDTDKFRDGYIRFVKENGSADAIIATNWPVMCYVARQVVNDLNLNIPVISWIHNPVDRYVAAGYGGVDLLNFADAHLAINNHIASDIKGHNANATVYRVNNPVDTSRVIYSENRREGKLFFAGRLSDQKNLEILIEGVAKAKYNWELTIIGEGPEERKLRRLCHNYGIFDRTIFVGWKDNPWELATEQTFFVMSSLYEGFPVTAIEALLSGLPIISTPVDGIVELIHPGENGYLYPMNDSAGLKEILDYISGGVLSIPTAKACQESAKLYTSDIASADFFRKVIEIIEVYKKQNG